MAATIDPDIAIKGILGIAQAIEFVHNPDAKRVMRAALRAAVDQLIEDHPDTRDQLGLKIAEDACEAASHLDAGYCWTQCRDRRGQALQDAFDLLAMGGSLEVVGLDATPAEPPPPEPTGLWKPPE